MQVIESMIWYIYIYIMFSTFTIQFKPNVGIYIYINVLNIPWPWKYTMTMVWYGSCQWLTSETSKKNMKRDLPTRLTDPHGYHCGTVDGLKSGIHSPVEEKVVYHIFLQGSIHISGGVRFLYFNSIHAATVQHSMKVWWSLLRIHTTESIHRNK